MRVHFEKPKKRPFVVIDEVLYSYIIPGFNVLTIQMLKIDLRSNLISKGDCVLS